MAAGQAFTAAWASLSLIGGINQNIAAALRDNSGADTFAIDEALGLVLRIKMRR